MDIVEALQAATLRMEKATLLQKRAIVTLQLVIVVNIVLMMCVIFF